MYHPKIRGIPVVAGRIFNNIEYSMSKERQRFLLLTGIFFTSFLLLFIATTWISVSTYGSAFGKAPLGDLNYVSSDLAAYWSSTIYYWQSEDRLLADKIDLTLNIPILVFGSYDYQDHYLRPSFNVTLGQLVSIVSMSILFGMFVNIWLLSRKCACAIGATSKASGIAAGTGGGTSGVLSMLVHMACCGGSGAYFLLFTLPFIGSLVGGLYAIFDTRLALLISIPASILMFGFIMLTANRFVIGVPTEINMTKRIVINNWFKVAIYLIVPVVLLSVFAMELYLWNVQSNMLSQAGWTYGRQDIVLAMYVTLPSSALLFLMSGYIQLHRIFHDIKSKNESSCCPSSIN